MITVNENVKCTLLKNSMCFVSVVNVSALEFMGSSADNQQDWDINDEIRMESDFLTISYTFRIRNKI